MSKIQYPKKPGRMVVVRDCTVAICNNNNPGAVLLSTLLFWYDNPHKYDTYDEKEQTFTMCRTQAEIEEQACNQIDIKTIHRTAVPFLQLFSYLTVKEKMNGNLYILHMDRILAAYAAYESGNKALRDFLKSSLQLDSCPIRIPESQLDSCLINRTALYLQLDSCLMANRQESNCKRGRKPKPKDTLRGISEETETIRDLLENDNRENNSVLSGDEHASHALDETQSHSQCFFCSEEAELTCHMCGKQVCYFEHGRRFPLTETMNKDYCLDCLDAHNQAMTAGESPRLHEGMDESLIVPGATGTTNLEGGTDHATHLPVGDARGLHPLPGAALGDTHPAGHDRKVAAPATRPVLEAQAEISEEGEHTHEHPQSHPSGSNSLGTGLQGAEGPGQDDALPTSAESITQPERDLLSRTWEALPEDTQHEIGDDHHETTGLPVPLGNGTSERRLDTDLLHPQGQTEAALQAHPLEKGQTHDPYDYHLHSRGTGGLQPGDSGGSPAQAEETLEQTPSRGGSAVMVPPEPSMVEPERDVVGVALVAPVPADTPSTTLPAQALPPSPEQAALGQAGTDDKGMGQEGKKAGRRTRQQPEKPKEVKPELTPEGEALYQDWCSLFHVSIPKTKAIIPAANELAEPIAIWAKKLDISESEVLRRIMNWLYKNNQTYYGEGRGVKLYDIHREFEGWQSAAERKLAASLRLVPPPQQEPVDKSKLFNMGAITLSRKGATR